MIHKGTSNPDSTYRVHEFETLTHETIIPNAEFIIVVSIDKDIYY
jgi:hypothetical protein